MRVKSSLNHRQSGGTKFYLTNYLYLFYFMDIGCLMSHITTPKNKTFNKRKNRALLTVRRSQKHYEIFSNNVLRKNITRKQLRLETIEIA